MNTFWKTCICLICTAAAVLALSGCGSKEAAETTAPTLEPIVLPTAPVQETVEETNPYDQVENLTVVMDAGELYTLDHYPNLKSVDLSGSICYKGILDYMENHPEVDVTFTVSLGGTEVSNKDSSATVNAGSFDFDTLLTNLQYLPNLTTLKLGENTLTAQQIEQLITAYPQLTLDYSVTLFGSAYSAETTQLDLSSMASGQVEEACGKLSLMTALTDVTLSSSLSIEDVDKLQTAAPHITFHYSFSLFGKTISTADTEIIYKDQNIGNSGEADIRKALTILDRCQRFVLDDCGLDYEVLAKIREDFRGGPKVVWRVYFGVGNRYTTVTDDDVIRCVENVTDSTCGPMKYLEDVVHADLGHNDTLTDLSFIGYMTKLETLIVSGCSVSDISGFENCKNLIWLEMSNCGKLKDITPLAECKSLRYLNLSFTGVKSYEALDSLPLERFMCLSPKASTKEQNTFTTIHPKGECITVFYGYSNPYGYGWRYDDNGKTMFWYYKDIIREVFNYDKADSILNAQKKAEGK